MAGVLGNPAGTFANNSVSDCNEISANGYYPFVSKPLNAPEGISTGSVLAFVSSSMRIQYFFTDVEARVYTRRKWYGNDWSAWQRIDNFGYNSLAELSAGVAGQRVYNHTSGNIEDINLKGISLFHFDKDHNPSATDYPFNFGDMIHAQLEGPDGNIYKIMVAVDVTGQIKIGRKWGRTGAMIWKTVSAS